MSDRARREYERFLEAHPTVASAWLDVIAERPLSRSIAEESGIRHESPQALLFVDGQCVWNASHGGITRQTLEEAVSNGS